MKPQYRQYGRAIYKGLRYGARLYSAATVGNRLGVQFRRNFGGGFNKYKKQFSHGGVTNQHDVRTIYRKRWMPRRRKRMWRGFVRKVNAVSGSRLGTKTILFNDTCATSAGAGAQNVAVVHLYGQSGTDLANEIGTLDLKEIVTAVTGTNNEKFHFVSGCLDITARNQLPAEPGTAINYTLEVDVYEVTYGRQEQKYPNLITGLTEGVAETSVLGTTPISYQTRGATLFDLPQAISNTRMTILKKTKYFLGGDQVFTYQVRDPRNYNIHGRDMLNRTNMQDFQLQGKTRSLFFIMKPVDVGNVGSQLVIGTTRSYKYKVDENNFISGGTL